MTTANLTERTVPVAGKPIFVAEAGTGPAVVMLHGGGPGASGVSNYSRNIDALAEALSRHRARYARLWALRQRRRPRSIRSATSPTPSAGCSTNSASTRAHLVGNSYGGAAALRLALDTPDRVDKLVLMGPGGIGTTRGLPTAGLKSLLSYYGGDGPSRDKLETFIRTYLVHDGASVPDELIDIRYQASIDPEVIADPPLRRPSRPTRVMADGLDPRPPVGAPARPRPWCCGVATTRSTGPPADRCCCNLMPNAELVMTSHTGHWMQWERAELFNRLVAEFLSAESRLAHV